MVHKLAQRDRLGDVTSLLVPFTFHLGMALLCASVEVHLGMALLCVSVVKEGFSKQDFVRMSQFPGPATAHRCR